MTTAGQPRPRAARTADEEHSQHAAASVRLTGPPAVVDAALASLAVSYGAAWQPGTRKPSRHSGGEVLQYGTLIVPVHRPGAGQ